MARSTAGSIDPIKYAASYQLAAEEIRRAIELGTYVPGDRLPPSRELSRQLGISVATLREAVRGLIDEGILEMRRGPKGGLVVLPSSAARGGRGKSRKVLLREIETTIEFRCAIEPYAAKLAAERRSAAQLAALETAHEEMAREVEAVKDPLRAARFKRADSRFHATIAEAAGNELLAAAIEDARGRMFVAVGAALRDISRYSSLGHEEILTAIKRRRPEAAAKAMLVHLEATLADVHEMVQKPPPRR